MLKNIFNTFQMTQDKDGKNIVRLFILLLIIASAIARIWIYGAPNLSIAGNDTISYVESSHVPLFSSEMMTGRRLLSTNLIYKFLEPKDGYQIRVNGSIDTTRRAIQPGFDRIVILQLVISITGWGLFAYIVADYLKTASMKIASVITILLFAFTPQMADWDSILMSESFTFSLFALQLALLVKIAFLIYKDPYSNNLPLFVIWGIVYFIWTFLRDTNLFASLVTIGMIGSLLVSYRYRKSKYLYGVLTFLVVISAIGLYTSGNSTRSLVQIINIYNDDLLRSPARVATLTELGMPTPHSPEYQEWFQENSTKALIKFMFIHPGYPVTKLLHDFPGAFTEIKQTYFKAPEQALIRGPLMAIGDALHPESTTPFLLTVLLLTGVILLGIRNSNETSRPWAWISIWLFLTASLTLIPTILGDTWALNRHALFSTMIYRLCMWLFALIIMDMALTQSGQSVNQAAQAQIYQS